MEPEELTLDCEPGELVTWTTLRGEIFTGVFKEWDNWTAIVTMEDGSEKAVRCN